MHPYRMQQMIKERGKDQVIDVRRRPSLYQTINQLLRAGLIAVAKTGRQPGFPERTIYRITEEGRAAALSWMREMLSTPAQEFPEFPAAVSLLPVLTPEDARAQLELRARRLAEQIAAMDKELQAYKPRLPRLFLLETEYVRRVMKAELGWVQSIVADLGGGELTWSEAWIRGLVPPKTED